MDLFRISSPHQAFCSPFTPPPHIPSPPTLQLNPPPRHPGGPGCYPISSQSVSYRTISAGGDPSDTLRLPGRAPRTPPGLGASHKSRLASWRRRCRAAGPTAFGEPLERRQGCQLSPPPECGAEPKPLGECFKLLRSQLIVAEGHGAARWAASAG